MKKLLLIIWMLPALACSTSIIRTAPASMGPIVTGVTVVTVEPSPPPSPMATAAAPEMCEVTADGLHVRDSPGIEGTVIAWTVKGDRLTILPVATSGVWVRVRTAAGFTGWINSHYCERLEP